MQETHRYIIFADYGGYDGWCIVEQSDDLQEILAIVNDNTKHWWHAPFILVEKKQMTTVITN